MPLRARFKRILDPHQPDPDPVQQQVTSSASSAAAQVFAPPAINATPQAALQKPPLTIQSRKTIPEQLWEAGYARLKDREPKLVQQYEAIQVSKIAGTPSIRSLTNSLEDIEKLTASKSKLENIDYVLRLKSVISAGVQTSWEASLAWAIVCSILEPLINIGREAVANRDGLLYIIERLEFNNKLSTLRIDPERSSNIHRDLQDEIRLRITTLYIKILHYLMQSSIYHKQFAVKTLAKDSFKIYNWAKLLRDVKDAEAAVDRDDTLRKAEEITSNLRALTNIARSQEDKECLRQLRVTDPRDDKKRIQKDKGGLLEDAYVWILDNDDYKAWRQYDPKSNCSQKNNILWIRGDPGKGKTMLLCGIIDELSKNDETLAFFFCQATDPRINSAESVIRGLLYMLAEEDRTSTVLSILRQKFDNAGAAAFNDTNAWIVMKDLFSQTIEALSEQRIWLVIDALDECNQRDRLLDLIDDAPSHVKWLVSSRNWDDIEERLNIVLEGQGGLSLELNANSVAKAVDTFINTKVSNLTKLKRLNETTTVSVQKYLSTNANGTFLWVALVCQSLSAAPCTRFNILELVEKFPQGLDAVYRRMIEQIRDTHEVGLTKRILSIVATVFRPLSLAELSHLLPNTTNEPGYLEHLVNQSGFLTSQSSKVEFLHLSAKEFLLKSVDLTIDGNSPHQLIYERSMETLCFTLKRNPYAMREVGCHVDDLTMSDHDPLFNIAYSCLYWTYHLLELWPTCSDTQTRAKNERMLRSFYLKKYLYWIEALVWLKRLPHSMVAMMNLKHIFSQTSSTRVGYQPQGETIDLYRDALRFILSAVNIQWNPLQVYASTLYFSPTSSLIRKAFELELPSWLNSKHEADSNWPRNAISLRIYNDAWGFKLSPDGQKLVVMGFNSSDIRNAVTGTIDLTLTGGRGMAWDAAFSADSRSVVIATDKGELYQYDCSTGRLMNKVIGTETSQDSYYDLPCVATAPEGSQIVHSFRQRLYFRDSGLNLLHEQEFEDTIGNLALTSNASRVAVATLACLLYLYDTKSRTLIWRKEFACRRDLPPGRRGLPLVFTPAGNQLFGADGEMVYCWDTGTGNEDFKFNEPATPRSLTYSGGDLCYPCQNGTIVRRSRSEVHTYLPRKDHRIVRSFAITPYWLISFSDGCLSFYDAEDITTSSSVQLSEGFRERGRDISPDGKRVAYPISNGMVRLWNTALSWQDICPFPDLSQWSSADSHTKDILASFSYDDRVAMSRDDGKIVLWNIKESPTPLFSFTGPTTTDYCRVEFSSDGSYACYSSESSCVVVTRKDFSTLTVENGKEYVLDVSIANGTHIALTKQDPRGGPYRVEVWDIASIGHMLHCLKISADPSNLSFNNDSSQLAYITHEHKGQYGYRVMEIASGQTLEAISFPRWPKNLSYSEKTGHFRAQNLSLYPDVRSMDLFVNESIYIDNVMILCLPVEYHKVSTRICDNVVTHALSPDRVSMLEVDIEDALRDETVRGQETSQFLR